RYIGLDERHGPCLLQHAYLLPIHQIRPARVARIPHADVEAAHGYRILQRYRYPCQWPLEIDLAALDPAFGFRNHDFCQAVCGGVGFYGGVAVGAENVYGRQSFGLDIVDELGDWTG